MCKVSEIYGDDGFLIVILITNVKFNVYLCSFIRMKKNIYIWLMGLCGNYLFSQDIHFSQYNGALLNLSPALTGFFDGDYRVNGIFRKQWQAVPVPYTTISMSAEGKVNYQKLKNKLAYGILFNHDKAGDAFYTINQLYLSAGYLWKIKKDSSWIANAGFSFGYVNNAFNYNRMTFDSQFDGLQYNSSISTNENFYRTSLHYWDMNIGIALKYILNQKFYFTGAANILHINSPVVTYYANTSSKVDRKFSGYWMMHYPINQKLFLVPEILLSFQGKYKEIIPGAQLSYLINNLEDIYGRVGLYWRTKDALILRIGLDYQTTSFGMSYDINISRFVSATNSRGGFEMYVIHIFKTKKFYLSKKKSCPVFL